MLTKRLSGGWICLYKAKLTAHVITYRVLSFEEKLKDTTTSYEDKLQVVEKKHRDAIVRLYVTFAINDYTMYM